jgi:hypothetical protein
LDPNIASVVMWTWNIELWYRYFGTTDNNWNLLTKWVFTNFVDLAESWHIQYGYTNNLWIKYALIYSDKELAKILNINDLQKVRNIRYYMMAVRFLPRMMKFEHNNKKLWINIYQQALDAIQKILVYRINNSITKWADDLLSDIADIYALNIENYKQIILNGMNNFNLLNSNEKNLFLQYIQISQVLKQNPNVINNIVPSLIKNSLWWRAQLIWVMLWETKQVNNASQVNR